ncbi:competence/damage-inducible protein A [Halocalculus aciditolerans]|uniref:Competence damage-inducible protein A n=1 Tax=Halocalculus aciditolerans TaxID=1383812 RepID=A0A830F4J2_9EURY|nr:molybdopterin-binding protein [Halocalculus aciditolerans]GGL61932.1 competence damage-inducible protein A [Halocalculus aciditolerans]
MDIALLTVGDELLTGATENTNASWLARELTARGATVTRILAVPDEPDVIEAYVRDWREEFDAVIVTGGLGGTHDDVTTQAVAAALGRERTVDPDVRDRIAERMRRYREKRGRDAVDIDPDAWAVVPEGARVVENDEGLSPGYVVGGDPGSPPSGTVYVTPGVPAEMRAVFERVADDFEGDVVSETIWTDTPEGDLGSIPSDAEERFDVTVGSYAGTGDRPNRITVRGTDANDVADAVYWLRGHVEETDYSEE